MISQIPSQAISPQFLLGPADDENLGAPDITALQRLMGEVACHRNDPPRWRALVLQALLRMLPASAAAAFVLQPVSAVKSPQVCRCSMRVSGLRHNTRPSSMSLPRRPFRIRYPNWHLASRERVWKIRPPSRGISRPRSMPGMIYRLSASCPICPPVSARCSGTGRSKGRCAICTG